MIVDFEFAPGDFVWVTAFGLNYRGRVSHVELRQNGVIRYSVEYVGDTAKIDSDFFHADELELADADFTGRPR